MLLVLFAVLLISQTVEKGVSSTVFDGRVCLYFLREGGDIMCSFAKVVTSGNFNAGSCSIGCTMDKRFVRLPDGVCGAAGALYGTCSCIALSSVVKYNYSFMYRTSPLYNWSRGVPDSTPRSHDPKQPPSCKPEVLEKLVKWKLDLEEMVKLKK
uniref:Putative conserved secreted protein n=1 Tax=Ixodes ricinus TaxID=34613 RepID=A0A6B0UVH7_IXORI